MKPIWIVILIALVIGNLIGGYILYKALNLRSENRLLNKYLEGLTEKNARLTTDYPGRSVYAEANRELLDSTTVAQRKELCVLYGASITRSWNIDRDLEGFGVVNRGVGSQSSTQLLARFSPDVLQLNPGRVVIKICAGNFEPNADAEAIWDEFETMVLAAQARGIEPVVATILPVTRAAEHFDGYSITEQVQQFNARARKLAVARQLRVIDYFEATADSDGFLPDDRARDDIHPNDSGYAKMSEVFRRAMK
jgi:lysophospholipase L1-like esterase